MSGGEFTTHETPPGAGVPEVGPDDPEEKPESRPVSQLVFPVGGYGLLVDQRGGMEFLENQSPFHVPNNHPRFRGLINRRGSLVPVFDIRVMLDDRPRAGDEARVLVVGTGDDAAGIVLDAVPYRLPIAEENRTTPPDRLKEVFGECLGDCFASGDSVQAFVQLDQFLYKLAHVSNN